MLNRTNQSRVEAAVEKNFDTKQYTWHKYTSNRGTKLKGLRGAEVVLRKGDLYGVKEYNSKQDMYLTLKLPTAVFKVNIAASDKLMNEKSVEVKGKKPTLPKNPPSKIKVDMAPPPEKKSKKTVKEAAAPSDMTYEASPIVCSHCKKKAKHGVIIKGKKYAIDCGADKLGLTTASLKKLIGAAASKPSTEKAPKAAKPKLTANQKKIVAVKMEIKRLRGMTQNATNLRKIEAQKAELKKLNAKEKLTATKPKSSTKTEPKISATKYAGAGKLTVDQTNRNKIIFMIDDHIVEIARRLSQGRYSIDSSMLGGDDDTKYVGSSKNLIGATRGSLTRLIADFKSGKRKWPFSNKIQKDAPAPKPTSAKTKTEKPVNVKLPPEFEAARTMLKAIDKGGVPLNTMKLNMIGRELGLEINSNAKPDATVERIRAAVERAVDSAIAEQAHSKKPTRMKVNLNTSHNDDDEDHDHNGIVDIDELDFYEEDLNGLVNIPLPESWSASTSGAKRKSKRMILDDDDEENEED